jgi:outer membrane receptor protein involved in Fe transport
MFLFGSITLYAQNAGTISGKVNDKATAQPLPYVSIVVKENGTTVTGAITADNGTFEIKNLPLKNYTVEVQFMGYKTKTVTAGLSESSKSINIGTVVIEEEATTLNEVEIVKEVSTIEQKIDRKVITVGRDLTTAGGTAAEIMNNIPTVFVDQDGNISLRGNQNVRVLVDGRPTNIDPAQLLKQIPSTSIKKIELITNPSAKYNPEGMSGIINIILHKNTNNGFNGNLNAGITFGEEPKFNNSLDMNYRVGKVNFFANVGSNFGEYFNDGRVVREDINSRQLFNIVNDNEGYLGKFGLDFYINDRNTISFYTNQNYGGGDGLVDLAINYPDGNGTNTNQISSFYSGNHNDTYNLAYKHKFEKEGHTLDFEGNYNDAHGTQDGNYVTTGSSTVGNFEDRIENEGKNITLNLDYVNPINEKSTLELGAEARIIGDENVYTTTNTNQDNPSLQDSEYTYDNYIYSAYATFGQRFGKISYQVGARFESYRAEANFNRGASTFTNDYVTVYPSAYFSYNLTEKDLFNFSYSRRVDRPSLEQTKPIREFSTPLLTSLGNQELRPQFTSSVELNYTKMLDKGSSISTSVFYRFINDEISRVLYPDETTANTQDLIMSFDNFDRNTSYGFEVSANYKITKWWDVQPAIDFSNISQKGLIAVQVPNTESEYEYVIKNVDVNAFNVRLNSNFRVNDRLSFLLFGFYRGPVNGVQNKTLEMYKIDSGARYTLLDNQMSLSLRFNDMFNTMRYAFNANNPFPQNGEFRWESRTVYFGINYRFGGGKNNAMQRRQRDNNTKQSSGGMF